MHSLAAAVAGPAGYARADCPEIALPPHPYLATLLRGAALFGLWLLLAGADPLGLPFGIAAAALATWASLALLPPAGRIPNPVAIATLLARLVRDSALAGWDIALRALAREPRLSPAVVTVALATPPGAARDAVRLLASLAPGTLPLEVGADASLPLHVLDTGLPYAAGLAAIERDFAAAFGTPHG
jgi:multicomponent Na+:H+ antiporter subunit E